MQPSPSNFGDAGISYISSNNSKITNSSLESIPQIQISLGDNDVNHNNNIIDNTNNSAHNRYSITKNQCNSISNSVSNILNDDDLTMELSSNNTTVFNYSSNERGGGGGVLASSGNNLNSLNGSNLIKAKRYD